MKFSFTKISSFLKSYPFIILGVFTILLNLVVSNFPNIVEQYYSKGLFKGIRWLFDISITRLPFPLFYGLLVFVLCLVVFSFFKKRKNPKLPFRQRLLKIVLNVVSIAGLFIFSFQWLWGFNYSRVPIETTLDLDLLPLNIKQIKIATTEATNTALQLRLTIPNASKTALTQQQAPKDLENEMRSSLEKVLEQMNYPTIGAVNIRNLQPKGVLMRIGTAGFYLPFMGEGNIDAGLHPLQLPHTIAHEMAHGYGFGDEGTCNFLAHLACQVSENAYVRYAGALTYWRYIAGEYKWRLPEEYEIFRANHLNEGMFNDLEAIYANTDLYPDFFPSLRNKVYDNYLKMQGIAEGMQSYNRVVLLVESSKKTLNHE